MRRTLALVFLVAAACYRETPDVSRSGPSQSSTSVQDPQATDTSPLIPVTPQDKTATASTTAAPVTAEARVELHEYAVRIAQTLPAGKHAFSVQNTGKETHSLEIHGPNGMHVALPDTLQRGDSTKLEVELAPGTYEVYCPVDGHKGKGMTTKVTVQ